MDVICIGGRKPKGGDTQRFEDFWPEVVRGSPQTGTPLTCQARDFDTGEIPHWHPDGR